ncbi:hypothetical protein J5N97_015523 [Dioscorea zingiberensis]|uniref:F-box domain-containing protein n=1 Tax=Dioscorea zingiberensis TaxID=325984 RepID=A0A9D5CVV7_9LILI|nr:hypothetical protein J5N97_015523 [Dioscorea zingiberensis]
MEPPREDCEDLIPGLPDDIALMCLARISHGYHGLLECVSKKWRAAIRGHDYVALKEKEWLCGNWLFALSSGEDSLNCVAYDPDADRWHPMPRVPTTQRCQGFGYSCVSVCQRFFIIGGSYTTATFGQPLTTNDVLLFDPFKKNWSRAACMRRERGNFACAVVLNKIYVAGGSNLCHEVRGLAAAEVYDPLEDRWDDLPPLPTPLLECHGVSRKGQFHVFGRENPDGEQDMYFRFDPADWRWHIMKDFQQLPRLTCLYNTIFNDRVYAVHNEGIIQFLDGDFNNWQTLGVVPSVLLPDHQRPLKPFGFGFLGFKKYMFLVGGGIIKFNSETRTYGITKLNSTLFCDSTKLPLEWRDARSMPVSSAGSTSCFSLEE